MADTTAPAGGAPSILVVEDERGDGRAFGRFLRREGWPVREAADAAAALDEVRAGSAGLLVVDLGSACGWLLLAALGGLAERPPVLALGGDARPETRARADELGVDGYVAGPVPLPELLAAVSQLAGAAPPLPGAAARDRRAPRPASRGRRSRTDGARPVVLLLDDDADARTIYRDMLAFAGFDVMAAADGVEGLRFAEARPPDVVVTDLHMPGMSGIDVARTFRSGERERLPIIVVTADTLGVEMEGHGRAALFDAVLVKPVSPGELVRAVRAFAAPAEDAAD